MSKAQRERIDAMLRAAPFDTTASPEQMRKDFAAMMGNRPLPEGVSVTNATLGGRPALRFRPAAPLANAVLLYFHGGSFIVGSPATAQTLTAALVTRTGLEALSLDYRLAPENPFPAAIEDGLAAYRELLGSGIPADRIVLAGDSAGGSLTLTTLLSARDAGLPMPAGVVAFSPGLDASGTGDSMTTKDGIDPIFKSAGLRAMRTHYLAGRDPRHPLLSPALYADPTGLPHLLLQVGTHEILLDDAVRFAARAAAADVNVILDVTGGVPHVFQSFTGSLDEADAALDRAATFLRQRLQAPRDTGT